MEPLVQRIPHRSLDDDGFAGSALVTASFDIRHAELKIAPVDANLFPAGWHQICSTSVPLAQQRFKSWAQRNNLNGKTCVLLVEPFTRNAPYFENVYALRALLEPTFGTVHLAMNLDALPSKGHEFQTTKGTLPIYPFHVRDGRPCAGDTAGDFLFLATDLSQGNDFLAAVESPIFPNPADGWHNRRKSSFFEAYNSVAEKFAANNNIDPWSITVHSTQTTIQDPDDLDALKSIVDQQLSLTRDKYREYEIQDVPFAVIKPSAGTFGRGVLMLADASELDQMNKKARKNLFRAGTGGDNGVPFLVQEGIYTRDLVDGCPSEPVLYAAGGAVIGGFYRSHCSRDPSTNLNSPGMVFRSICADDNRNNVEDGDLGALQGLYYAIGEIAMHGLAAELNDIDS